MIDDLIPIVIDLPVGEDIKISPISDLHYGSPQFKAKEWKDFIQRVTNEPNHHVIIAGDMINNALKSSVSNIYEETCRPSEQKRWLAEQLKPIKDKIICGVSGNHERRSMKDSDDNPLYDVFAKLDIEDRYRENAAFVLLRIGASERNLSGKDRPSYSICVTHGNGNGTFIGSSANKVEKFGMAIDGIDCIVSGHTHKPITFPSGKLFFDTKNKKVSVKQFIVVTATSWLNYGGYALAKGYSPAAFRQNEIILSAKSKDIKVIQ